MRWMAWPCSWVISYFVFRNATANCTSIVSLRYEARHSLLFHSSSRASEMLFRNLCCLMNFALRNVFLQKPQLEQWLLLLLAEYSLKTKSQSTIDRKECLLFKPACRPRAVIFSGSVRMFFFCFFFFSFPIIKSKWKFRRKKNLRKPVKNTKDMSGSSFEILIFSSIARVNGPWSIKMPEIKEKKKERINS